MIDLVAAQVDNAWWYVTAAYVIILGGMATFVAWLSMRTPASPPGIGSTVMRYRAFLIPAIGILIVLGGLVLTFTLNDSFVYYMTPTEAIDSRADFADGRRFRLSGVVVPGSVEELDTGVRFQAQDPEADVTVTVVHTRAAPQLFQENIGVVVEGAWAGDEFHSDFMLIKHDEEYRVPEDGNYDGDEANS